MIHREGPCYILEAEQFLDRTPAELFPFFADAANLARITPDWLNFEVRTPPPIEMAVGTLIDYRIRMYGVPMNWRTEIIAWRPPHRFIDTQIRGPYQTWVHEHTFQPHDGGTIMRDHVRFRARGPAVFIPLVHRLFVNRNVQRIFAHRQQVMRDLFPIDDTSTQFSAEQKRV